MRIAVISDVHANWEALQTVLADIQRQGIKLIYCLGDVIGYGADPKACLNAVAQHCRIVLQGNHEHALFDPELGEAMNKYASIALQWTRKQLSEVELDLIQAWPVIQVGSDARLVHASPQQPARFAYLESRFEYELAFENFSELTCFCGHTHCPMVASITPARCLRMLPIRSQSCFQSSEIVTVSLDSDERAIINVGSVGQPRDQDPRARWVSVQTEPAEVTFHFLPYAIAETQRKIREAGLPSQLADRLQTGR